MLPTHRYYLEWQLLIIYEGIDDELYSLLIENFNLKFDILFNKKNEEKRDGSS